MDGASVDRQQRREASDDGEAGQDAFRWQERLIRRLEELPPGRYSIILTVGKEGRDWSVGERLKVEK